jgi:hypothetical protein
LFEVINSHELPIITHGASLLNFRGTACGPACELPNASRFGMLSQTTQDVTSQSLTHILHH